MTSDLDHDHRRAAAAAPGPAPTRRRAGRAGRALTLGALLTGAALSLSVAACGSDDTATSTAGAASATTVHEHHAEGEAAVDGDLVTITMDDYSFAPIETALPAGAVRIRAVNAGHEDHEVQIARPRAGVTAESFVQTYEEQGEPAAMAGVELVGGVHGVRPGTTIEGVAELDPGRYLLLCFFPGADGQSHVVKGMVDSFEVTRLGAPEHAPHADATATAQDFTLAIPDGWDGHGLLELRNDGTVDHEVVFLRVADGHTTGDVLTWFAAQEGPPPFEFTGGVAAVAAGTSGWVDLDLDPGSYLAACFVPTPEGAPHAALGMLTTFTIA